MFAKGHGPGRARVTHLLLASCSACTPIAAWTGCAGRVGLDKGCPGAKRPQHYTEEVENGEKEEDQARQQEERCEERAGRHAGIVRWSLEKGRTKFILK